MAEKKIQENSVMNTSEQSGDEAKEGQIEPPEKLVTTPVVPVVAQPPPHVPETRVSSFPSFTKAAPNDLYRRLLPAALFLLTFVTVMTILLIYMDTVALGAQQFRVNMSRDYDLRRIAQDEPSFVTYIRQFHLQPTPPAHQKVNPPVMETDPFLPILEIFKNKDNGTFVEFLSSGARDPTALSLEVRGWRGLVVRAAPRDYLRLRAAPPPRHRALHACLSPTDHPREVSYVEHEEGPGGAGFSSRVLCLPLYTALLAADLAVLDLLVLGGAAPAPALALAHLPYHKVQIKVIDVRDLDATNRDNTTQLLMNHNYTVKAQDKDHIVYQMAANDGAPATEPAITVSLDVKE